MRPGAGQGDIEMITPGLGSVAADPRRAGRTVSGHPVAENTVPTHETSAAGRGIVPLIVPTTVNEQSHFILLANRRRALGVSPRRRLSMMFGPNRQVLRS